jgi:glutamate-5-semialdehyde dehydrogenase
VIVQEQAQKARTAALTLSSATRATKDAALLAMADSLAKSETAILQANARDVARAEADGTSAALIDRLRLTPDRVAGMVEGLRELAALPDPVGDVVRSGSSASSTKRGRTSPPTPAGSA